MFKIPINQQINTYLRQQQALARQMADIKKADPTRQDRKSAFTKLPITLNSKKDNQYETV